MLSPRRLPPRCSTRNDLRRSRVERLCWSHGTREVSMRPFEGIRVIDVTHVLAGPFATYQLAVLGADVIKVEHPDDPDQSRGAGTDKELNRCNMGTAFLTQASNKRSITLDLKQARDRDILKKLVATADVFVENYRPGAFDALGLGYDVDIARATKMRSSLHELSSSAITLADKAARTAMMLTERLDHHRNQGKQQIVVQHTTTVNANQAVVTDSVVTGKKNEASSQRAPGMEAADYCFKRRSRFTARSKLRASSRPIGVVNRAEARSVPRKSAPDTVR